MRYKCWLLALLFLSVYAIGYAQMYIWVDENGVKHFTDSPPNPAEVSPEAVQQAETSKYVFSHRLYKKDGELEYCGNYKLPVRKRDDSSQTLMDAKRVYDMAKETRETLSTDIASSSSESFKKALRKTLGEYECAQEWAASVIKELENAGSQGR